MGRVLKGIFEVLIMAVLAVIALIVSFVSPEKKEEFMRKQNKNIDSFEKDLHDKYAAGEISEMQFSEGLDKIENARKK